MARLIASPGSEAPESTFDRCYASEYRPLRRYVKRLAGGQVEADDVVQEAFARLWNELERGEQIDNPRAWLYRVVRNLTINVSKRQADFVKRVSPSIAAARFACNPESAAVHRQLVRRALTRLNEPMRQALLLSHAGLTGEEIASTIGVKASYVGTLVLRAHERFRREIKAMEED